MIGALTHNCHPTLTGGVAGTSPLEGVTENGTVPVAGRGKLSP
jgi:hypothetical protein